MKELSIEEKAKRYDEAIKKLCDFYRDYDAVSHLIDVKEELANLFPELCESEDEKIRKKLKHYLEVKRCQTNDDDEFINCNYFLTWLEKQEGCEYIKKDWLEHIKQSWYKEGFIDGKYSGVKEWTINDDATLKEIIDFLENGTAKLQHDLTRYANWLKIQFTPIEKQSEQKQKPTNEDMVEALRTEYEKGRADAFAQMQEEWSEEDEVKINRIVACLENLNVADNDILLKDVDWLKSLKDRYTWKPSDEQMEAVKRASNGSRAIAGNDYLIMESLYDDLKKLKGE